MQISKLYGDINFRDRCQFARKPTLLLLNSDHVAGHCLKLLWGEDLFLQDGIALQSCNLPSETLQKWILLSNRPLDPERRLRFKFNKFLHGLLEHGLILQSLILCETILKSKLYRMHRLLLIHQEFEQNLLYIHQVNLFTCILIIYTQVLVIFFCTSVADEECLWLLVLVEVLTTVLNHGDIQRADTEVLVHRIGDEAGWVR